MNNRFDSALLWSGIAFRAQNGGVAALLQAAPLHKIALKNVHACLGGFTAHCTALHYLRLAKLARRYHVRLQVQARTGLYFPLRRTLHRTGLWAGIILFGGLLLFASRLVWSVQYPGLTVGQQERAAAALRAQGIRIGAYVDDTALSRGETALMENEGEFAWASLNFTGGRLTVEAQPTKEVPEIARYQNADILAKASGTVLSLDVRAGTPQVRVGQAVAAGQLLVSASRADRSGAAVPGRTSASIMAQVAWTGESVQPLAGEANVPELKIASTLKVSFWSGKAVQVALPYADETAQQVDGFADDVRRSERHYGLALLGMPLPAEICETDSVPYTVQTVAVTESLALARARLSCLRALQREWPGAEILTVSEQYETTDSVLNYHVDAQIRADISMSG